MAVPAPRRPTTRRGDRRGHRSPRSCCSALLGRRRAHARPPRVARARRTTASGGIGSTRQACRPRWTPCGGASRADAVVLLGGLDAGDQPASSRLPQSTVEPSSERFGLLDVACRRDGAQPERSRMRGIDCSAGAIDDRPGAYDGAAADPPELDPAESAVNRARRRLRCRDDPCFGEVSGTGAHARAGTSEAGAAPGLRHTTGSGDVARGRDRGPAWHVAARRARRRSVWATYGTRPRADRARRGRIAEVGIPRPRALRCHLSAHADVWRRVR